MAKDKIDKQTAIKSILSDLKKGIDKPDIMRKIAPKCGKSKSTQDRWFAEAEKQYLENQNRLRPIKEKAEEEAVYEATKEAIKTGILSKLERQKILSDIAKGDIPLSKYIVCDGIIHEREIIPNWADRKAAIAELNKMDGEYAPIKTDITSKGNKLKSEISIIQIEIVNPLEDDD